MVLCNNINIISTSEEVITCFVFCFVFFYLNILCKGKYSIRATENSVYKISLHIALVEK